MCCVIVIVLCVELSTLSSVAYGIYEISESLGSVIGNAAVGFVRDETTSWDLDLQIFIAMSLIAAALTIILIIMDSFHCIGVGVGKLNESSFIMGQTYDRLKRKKDRHLQRQASQRGLKQKRAADAAAASTATADVEQKQQVTHV